MLLPSPRIALHQLMNRMQCRCLLSLDGGLGLVSGYCRDSISLLWKLVLTIFAPCVLGKLCVTFIRPLRTLTHVYALQLRILMTVRGALRQKIGSSSTTAWIFFVRVPCRLLYKY